MGERLEYIRLQPARVLDLGCGAGADLALLRQRYPGATCIGLDFALPYLHTAQSASKAGFMQRLFGKPAPILLACSEAQHLPLSRASVSLVWSNLLLNWVTDPMPVLREVHRVLDTGGLLMFSTLGPDTLRELRGALPDHAGERVHRFPDMHDLGDCLVQAGFSDPVMDMHTLTLTYSNLEQIFADLRQSGSSNASETRPRGLSGRQGWQHARQALEAQRVDGRLPVTFELVFGHAWKAAPSTTEDGRSIIHFQPRRTV